MLHAMLETLDKRNSPWRYKPSAAVPYFKKKNSDIVGFIIIFAVRQLLEKHLLGALIFTEDNLAQHVEQGVSINAGSLLD